MFFQAPSTSVRCALGGVSVRGATRPVAIAVCAGIERGGQRIGSAAAKVLRNAGRMGGATQSVKVDNRLVANDIDANDIVG